MVDPAVASGATTVAMTPRRANDAPRRSPRRCRRWRDHQRQNQHTHTDPRRTGGWLNHGAAPAAASGAPVGQRLILRSRLIRRPLIRSHRNRPGLTGHAF
jgi:hypothetical protein